MDTNPDLPDEVVDAIQRGRKIEAIKRLRQAEGMGLKEAKEAVEGWSRVNSPLVESAGPTGTLLGKIIVLGIALAAWYAVYRFMNGL